MSLFSTPPLSSQAIPLLVAILRKPKLASHIIETLLTLLEQIFESCEVLGALWTQHNIDQLLNAMQTFIPQVMRIRQRFLIERTFAFVAALTKTLSSVSHASHLIRLLFPFLKVRSLARDSANSDVDCSSEAHETHVHILSIVFNLLPHVDQINYYVPPLACHFLAVHSPTSIKTLISVFKQLAAHPTGHDLDPLVCIHSSHNVVVKFALTITS
jgi:hypothetical protein